MDYATLWLALSTDCVFYPGVKFVGINVTCPQDVRVRECHAGTLFGTWEGGASLYKGLDKREWGPSHANLLILQFHLPSHSSSS
jgi:hypothetical protein